MPDVRELSDKALELAGSGQYEKALEFVHKAIKLDANNPNAWYNQGILLFRFCQVCGGVKPPNLPVKIWVVERFLKS